MIISNLKKALAKYRKLEESGRVAEFQHKSAKA